MCHDTLPLFQQLQTRRSSTPAHDWWRAVHDFSTAVSVVLGRSDEAPTLASVTASAAQRAQSATDAGDWLDLNRAVWELLDTCFVDQARGDGSVADALASWLRRNYVAVFADAPCEGSLAPALHRLVPACASAPRPEEVPEYWPTLALLVACGWTGCALELLQQHSAWADWRLRKPAAKPIVAVLEALERLLVHAPHGEGTRAHGHTQAWRAAVVSTLGAANLWTDVEGTRTGEGARRVVAILGGDQDAVLEACADASWVELLVALLCHVHPSCSTPRDLVRLAAACMGRKHVLERGPTMLEELLVAALGREAPEVIRICATGLDAWMNAHVPDILSASSDAYDLVHTPLPTAARGAVSVTAWYRMQYADACAANPPLLHVACAYYAASGSQGAQALHALLCAAGDAVDTSRQMQAFSLAQHYGDAGAAAHVCIAAGASAEASGALGEAIQWYIRGDRPEKLAALVDCILPPHPWQAPDTTLVTSCLDSIGQVGDHPTGPVAFLAHWAAMHNAIDDARCTPGEHARHHEAKAATALRALLNSNDIPRERWPAALFASLPLLESPCGTITADDTALMAARLQELALHPWEPQLIGELSHPEAQAQMAAVKLALTRNLARAYMTVNTAN